MLSSLQGVIAACKGGSYSDCADEIAIFLVEMACTGTSSFPFSRSEVEFSCSNDDISILPALSFGSILSVYNGSPFWRQRIVFKTASTVIKVVQEEAQSPNPPSYGPLAVCSILCCFPSSLLSEASCKQLLPMMIGGLVHLSQHLATANQAASLPPNILDVLGINLAALVKILSSTPEVVSAFVLKSFLIICVCSFWSNLTRSNFLLILQQLTRFTGVIISSLLRLCACTYGDELFFPKQLLALQCLENVVKAPYSRNAKLRERDQVVNALSTVVDHPSAIMRQAVVNVRNIWFCL